MSRKAAVAGLFYPKRAADVEDMIDSFGVEAAVDRPVALGVVTPHAGYRYSGPTAARVFAAVKLAPAVIIVGPNHRGAGLEGFPPKAAIMDRGEWDLPSGQAVIDHKLAKLLLEESPLVTVDSIAHVDEHSLEVQIPIIQHYQEKVAMVPVAIGHLSDRETLTLAGQIRLAIERYQKPVTMIASTDFSHYVTDTQARRDDRLAIEKIEQLDGQGLLDTVRRNGISMCGYGPVALTVEVCKAQGATSARLVDYRTSAESSGDYGHVVGYGGLVIY